MAERYSAVMKIIGTNENINRFCDALNHKSGIWIGRDFQITSRFDNDNHTLIGGIIERSIQSSLIDDAISMREHPEHWSRLNADRIITLIEASEEWNLEIEFFTKGEGCQHHMIIKNGKTVLNERMPTRGGFDWEFAI